MIVRVSTTPIRVPLPDTGNVDDKIISLPSDAIKDKESLITKIEVDKVPELKYTTPYYRKDPNDPSPSTINPMYFDNTDSKIFLFPEKNKSFIQWLDAALLKALNKEDGEGTKITQELYDKWAKVINTMNLEQYDNKLAKSLDKLTKRLHDEDKLGLPEYKNGRWDNTKRYDAVFEILTDTMSHAFDEDSSMLDYLNALYENSGIKSVVETAFGPDGSIGEAFTNMWSEMSEGWNYDDITSQDWPAASEYSWVDVTAFDYVWDYMLDNIDSALLEKWGKDLYNQYFGDWHEYTDYLKYVISSRGGKIPEAIMQRYGGPDDSRLPDPLNFEGGQFGQDLKNISLHNILNYRAIVDRVAFFRYDPRKYVITSWKNNWNKFSNTHNESTFIRPYKNHSIEMLINSGPDFMKNKFDVCLVVFDSETHKVTQLFDGMSKLYVDAIGYTLPENSFGDSAAFMIRTSQVNIPQMESDTYEQKFLWHSIKKVRSKVKYERKAELKFRLDEPLAFLTFFNLLSNNNTVTQKIGTSPLYYAPFTTNRLLTSESIKHRKLGMHLIVKHQSLMRLAGTSLADIPSSEVYNSPKYTPKTMPPDKMPYWLFEDIFFLGSNDGLSFDRDSSNTQDITVPFIFKRAFKVDTQDRGETKLNMSMNDIEDSQKYFKTQSDQNWYYDLGVEQNSDKSSDQDSGPATPPQMMIA